MLRMQKYKFVIREYDLTYKSAVTLATVSFNHVVCEVLNGEIPTFEIHCISQFSESVQNTVDILFFLNYFVFLGDVVSLTQVAILKSNDPRIRMKENNIVIRNREH